LTAVHYEGPREEIHTANQRK